MEVGRSGGREGAHCSPHPRPNPAVVMALALGLGCVHPAFSLNKSQEREHSKIVFKLSRPGQQANDPNHGRFFFPKSSETREGLLRKKACTMGEPWARRAIVAGF